MPDEPEALGLLALMLLHDARRGGRVDAAGDLVPLERAGPHGLGPGADRARTCPSWTARCAAGSRARTRSRRPSPPATRPPRTASDTDWPQIAGLYAELAELAPSPVVELNRAVAVAMADGPAAGLALVDALAASEALAGYHLLPATRADLLRRLGRDEEAAAAYREALDLVTSDAERRYLTRRLSETTQR